MGLIGNKGNNEGKNIDILGSWNRGLEWDLDSQTRYNQRWHRQMPVQEPCFRRLHRYQIVFESEPQLLLAFWAVRGLLEVHCQWVSEPSPLKTK